jgi:hypothetical protein
VLTAFVRALADGPTGLPCAAQGAITLATHDPLSRGFRFFKLNGDTRWPPNQGVVMFCQ